MRLQGIDQAQFVLRAGPGKDITLNRHPLQRQVVEPGNFIAGHGPFGLQAQLAADGSSGHCMVAGDHLDADTGALAFRHGGDGFVARWVDQAHQTKQGETPGDVGHRQRDGVGRHVAARQRQHTLTVTCRAVHARLPGRQVERLAAGVMPAQGQHALGCALEQHKAMAGMVMVQRGHESVLGLERNFVGARCRRGSRDRVQPGLARQCQQCALGGVADEVPAAVAFVFELGVVAQQGTLRQCLQCRMPGRLHGTVGLMKTTLRGIAGAAHLQRVALQHDLHHRHFVFGQGAGLVRTDHRDRTQGFHGRQAPDDGLVARHDARADGQHDRDNGWQAFRDGSHGEADHRQENVKQRQPTQVIPVQKGDQGRAQNEQRDLARELVQAPCKRRRQRMHFAHQGADAANFTAWPGRHHQGVRLAVAHHRTRIRHASAIANGGAVRHRLGRFLDRHRFTGQRGFVDAQVFDLQQAQVSRHLDARLKPHQVTRHQLVGINFMLLAVAQHGGTAGQHGAHRVKRLFCLALLDETDQGVDDHHTGNDAGIDVILQGKSHDARGQQHINQRVVKLQRKAQPRPAPLGHRQAVGAVLVPPLADLVTVQTGLGIDL